jgi:hypothetical protein
VPLKKSELSGYQFHGQMRLAHYSRVLKLVQKIA